MISLQSMLLQSSVSDVSHHGSDSSSSHCSNSNNNSNNKRKTLIDASTISGFAIGMLIMYTTGLLVS
jgi:hypothetical protein